MNDDLRRRVRVLQLRQRVEMRSWRIYTRTLGLSPQPVWHRNVVRRLSLFAAWTSDAHDFHVLRVSAVELAQVYGECCDVLHGRKAYAALCDPVVAGWEATVERGEQAIRAALA